MRKLAPRTTRGPFAAVLQYFAARRALLPFVLSVAYVVAGALQGGRAGSSRPILVGGLALLCAGLAASPSLPGNGLRDDGRRGVGLLAYAVWGLALVFASLASSAPDLWQDLTGGVAALSSAVLATRALARIRPGHGVADSLPAAPRGQLMAGVGMIAAAAVVAVLVSARALEDPGAGGDPLPHDVHALAAGAALLVLAGSAWETLRTKRLVLDAGDRAHAALWVVVATSAAAAGFLFLDQGAADRVLRLSLALAALGVTYISTEGDAENIARRGRRTVALLLFGGPFVLLGGLAAQGPGRSVIPLLVTGVVALGIGSAIRYLELPLRRADGHLLDAVVDAESSLVRADPETSVRDALAALRTFAGLSSHSPELWSLVPPRVLTIDGAGYPHERDAELPQHLLDVAKGEPEATVRTELLEALVVRRPDLRPLARWMDEHGALSATLITREREVDGVLVLPRGARRSPMSLEEVRAVRRLADAFSGAAAGHAALQRSLARERVATMRADETEARLLARERVERRMDEHDRVLTTRLAEPAQAGPYSPGARVAFEAIERAVVRGAPLLLVAPNGADVIPFLARAHLAGPRSRMAFVVVDGAAPVHHELARWVDPVLSPLALAHGGELVLEDGMRLPLEVQRVVGETLAQRRAPWSGLHRGTEPIDITLAVTTPGLPRRIATGADLLDPALFALLDDALDHPVVWPPLRERGEDLRSMVLSGLAREGLRLRGAPLGIEDAAYERLADLPYAGEDAELRSILKQLAAVAEGEVVRAEDVVKALGQNPEASRLSPGNWP